MGIEMKKLSEIRDAIEQIVATTGEDAGVLLLSHESETEYCEIRKCHVYKNEYFSELGEALIKLWKMTDYYRCSACPTGGCDGARPCDAPINQPIE